MMNIKAIKHVQPFPYKIERQELNRNNEHSDLYAKTLNVVFLLLLTRMQTCLLG